jgi:hypothetical protein
MSVLVTCNGLRQRGNVLLTESNERGLPRPRSKPNQVGGGSLLPVVYLYRLKMKLRTFNVANLASQRTCNEI